MKKNNLILLCTMIAIIPTTQTAVNSIIYAMDDASPKPLTLKEWAKQRSIGQPIPAKKYYFLKTPAPTLKKKQPTPAFTPPAQPIKKPTIKKKARITHQGFLNLLAALDAMENTEITELKNSIIKKIHTVDAETLDPFFNTIETWMKVFRDINKKIITLTKADSRATFMRNLQNFAHKQKTLTPENYTILLAAYTEQPEELKKQIQRLAQAHSTISKRVKDTLEKLNNIIT